MAEVILKLNNENEFRIGEENDKTFCFREKINQTFTIPMSKLNQRPL